MKRTGHCIFRISIEILLSVNGLESFELIYIWGLSHVLLNIVKAKKKKYFYFSEVEFLIFKYVILLP